MPALLTIAVPTYNRAKCLSVLLRTLCDELAGLQDVVEVVVSDNASIDDTPALVKAFHYAWPASRVMRNATNIGADANISQCVACAQSKYVWVIGDDDVPKAGVVRRLVDVLRKEAPDMIYMQSEWVTEVANASQGGQITGDLDYSIMTQTSFARLIHVWFTFISGVIINKDLLLASGNEASLRQYIGTNFVQLGWVLSVLKIGSKFCYVSDRCVLATSGNTGGYAVLTTFGANYPRVISDIFGKESALARLFVSRNLLCYLPHLVWQVRFANIGNFAAESPWPILQKELSGYWYFWLMVAPIGRYPKYFAWLFFQISRVVAKFVRIYDRLASMTSRHLKGAVKNEY